MTFQTRVSRIAPHAQSVYQNILNVYVYLLVLTPINTNRSAGKVSISAWYVL